MTLLFVCNLGDNLGILRRRCKSSKQREVRTSFSYVHSNYLREKLCAEVISPPFLFLTITSMHITRVYTTENKKHIHTLWQNGFLDRKHTLLSRKSLFRYERLIDSLRNYMSVILQVCHLDRLIADLSTSSYTYTTTTERTHARTTETINNHLLQINYDHSHLFPNHIFWSYT